MLCHVLFMDGVAAQRARAAAHLRCGRSGTIAERFDAQVRTDDALLTRLGDERADRQIG